MFSPYIYIYISNSVCHTEHKLCFHNMLKNRKKIEKNTRNSYKKLYNNNNNNNGYFKVLFLRRAHSPLIKNI